MNRKIIRISVILFCISTGSVLHAETGYVVDQLMAGLHSDKAQDSTILKVIPTGTELKILDRDGDFVYVEDPDGDKGWIDNSYLMNEQPARQLLQELRNRYRDLEVELENTRLRMTELQEKTDINTGTDRVGIDPDQYENLARENTDLKQQVKTEQLKAGELQARITELRNIIAQTGNGESFDNQIEQLKQEKKLLEQQLNDRVATEVVTDSRLRKFIASIDWRTRLAIIAIILITGMVIGAYLLDYFYRLRHGGFRV